ncbi:MAG: hypothetical protein HZY73_01390 [Micropruina sp.]|nr:MAG: hypothetical protein HZY73_01390 [Micropruina sp.]
MRDHLEALVRVRGPQPQHLVVVDLAMAAQQAREGVEILGRHGHVQPAAEFVAFGLRGPSGEAGDVTVHDGVVEAVLAQGQPPHTWAARAVRRSDFA